MPALPVLAVERCRRTKMSKLNYLSSYKEQPRARRDAGATEFGCEETSPRDRVAGAALPRRRGCVLVAGHLGAVSRAAALALAAVLALAAIVAALATAIAFAGVLTLTSMLFGLFGVVFLVLASGRERGLCVMEHGRSLDNCAGASEQASNRRASDESLGGLSHR